MFGVVVLVPNEMADKEKRRRGVCPSLVAVPRLMTAVGFFPVGELERGGNSNSPTRNVE